MEQKQLAVSLRYTIIANKFVRLSGRYVPEQLRGRNKYENRTYP